MLKFLGIGSCFNFEMENTSAYYLKDNSLFLIDCGETVFSKLGKKGILNGLKEITIVITHLHSDHVGSLPSLIFYAYYVLNLIPNIIFPIKKEIIEYVLHFVERNMYNLYTPKEYNDIINTSMIYEIQQDHANMYSYGYEISLDGKYIFYSGDTNSLRKDILNNFLNYQYDYFYHEVTRFQNYNHYFICELRENIPKERRKDVICIHIDDKELLKILLEDGFSIPEY